MLCLGHLGWFVELTLLAQSPEEVGDDDDGAYNASDGATDPCFCAG